MQLGDPGSVTGVTGLCDVQGRSVFTRDHGLMNAGRECGACQRLETGGESSLALTLLCLNSLLTGKNTGNLRDLLSKMHTPFSKLHILIEKVARLAQIGTGTYQGINRRVFGNLFADQGIYCRTDLV